MIEFKKFDKISRWNNTDWIITEKIDGTNACVIIDEAGNIAAQSRSRIITPGKETDNFGFAQWVENNKDTLKYLGPGYWYGEWWGRGIQREYDIEERRFSLFAAWRAENIPACCHLVPLFKNGITIEEAVEELKTVGSKAAPGFMTPEGLIITHKHYKVMFKVLL